MPVNAQFLPKRIDPRKQVVLNVRSDNGHTRGMFFVGVL